MALVIEMIVDLLLQADDEVSDDDDEDGRMVICVDRDEDKALGEFVNPSLSRESGQFSSASVAHSLSPFLSFLHHLF